MSSGSDFRNSEEEVAKLIEECAELRRTLKSISAQVGRIENRVKLAFPIVAKSVEERQKGRSISAATSLTAEQALAEFDRVVALVAAGANEEAERVLDQKSPADMLSIAKELGVTINKSRPSTKALRDAIFGKVRESVLLSRHNTRG